MKKHVLFLAMMLLGLTSATATTAGDAVLNREDLNTTRYRFAEPIVFIERGVEFLIFPDGSFDFNTDFGSNHTEVYYRTPRPRRGSINPTYGAPGTVRNVQFSSPRTPGVIITHNSLGQVRRIGNVFINYDRQGRIKRAGSVYMSYQRGNGLLRQVGGLRVSYNRWGEIVHVSGMVNPSNTGLTCGVGSGYGGHNNTGFTTIDNYDEDYYYYRKNGEIKNSKKRIRQ